MRKQMLSTMFLVLVAASWSQFSIAGGHRGCRNSCESVYSGGFSGGSCRMPSFECAPRCGRGYFAPQNTCGSSCVIREYGNGCSTVTIYGGSYYSDGYDGFIQDVTPAPQYKPAPKVNQPQTAPPRAKLYGAPEQTDNTPAQKKAYPGVKLYGAPNQVE